LVRGVTPVGGAGGAGSEDAADPTRGRDAARIEDSGNALDVPAVDTSSGEDARPIPSDAWSRPIGDVPASPPARTCTVPRTFPRIVGRPFTLGGQAAFFHDEGDEYGFFHTYDGLVACSGDTARKVHVLLPRDYETSGRRYPVLYMNDGQTAFFTDNPVGKTWDVQEVLSDLRRCGESRDIVVVAPVPLDRGAEYSHADVGDGSTCCEVEAYTRYLVDCLGGFIEANYRVETGPESTALLGSSRGGLAAFWVASAHPERFGHVAAVSPSFWVGLDDRATGAIGDTALRDSALYAHARPALLDPARRPAIWIDWGLVRSGGDHNGIIESMATVRGEEMVALLESDLGYVRTGIEPGSELVAVEDPDGEHTEETWNVRLPWILRWMFPAP
jgi:predicted alpha/beta superfamily hydrolase